MVQETYTYDGLNRLSTAWRDGALVDARSYDGASRVLSSGSALAIDGGVLNNPGYAMYYLQATNSALQVRTTTYDPFGRVHQQAISEVGYSLLGGRSVTRTNVDYDKYDDAGNLRHYHSITLDFQTGQSSGSESTNTMTRQEGYALASSVSLSTNAAGQSRGALFYGYDSNGHLIQSTDSQNLGVTREHHFVNDVNGTALYAYYGSAASPEDGQRQMVVNGEVLGRYARAALHMPRCRVGHWPDRADQLRSHSTSSRTTTSATTRWAACAGWAMRG